MHIALVKLLFINALLVACYHWLIPEHTYLFAVITALSLVLLLYTLKQIQQREKRLIRLISDGLLSLHDGEFSVSLSPKQSKEQVHLVTLFNQVAEKLRVERQSLYQRELMLDKVINASNVITLLIDHRDTLVFANLAAKHFMNSQTIIGQNFYQLLEKNMPQLSKHLAIKQGIVQFNSHTSSVNSMPDEADFAEQSFHLSQHQLKLHGVAHQLILLKPITQALNRQELQTWKKVIRVINHELNNSIAPISSMCHSGNLLAEKLENNKLRKVFDTIGNRINKLSEFIHSYSQLAKISTPNKSPIGIDNLLARVQSFYDFELTAHSDKNITLLADDAQLEQLLINLLKNAGEATQLAGNNQLPQVSIKMLANGSEINVSDFGTGMDESLMMQAFLPYYSTKANGSGIGLTICRDIVEVHHGSIQLSNNEKGGLTVSVFLPIVE